MQKTVFPLHSHMWLAIHFLLFIISYNYRIMTMIMTIVVCMLKKENKEVIKILKNTLTKKDFNVNTNV